jgi:UDP-N-acetylglucosamine transferase subunit ALG13
LPEFCKNLKIINQLTLIKELTRPKILIAPLDWGLGHATRIIPIVHYLQQVQCQIWIAASGQTEKVLKETFPGIPFLHLDGYKVNYQGRYGSFSLKMASQIPKIIRAVHFENDWLNKNQEIYHWDAVISDNRYGLYHKELRSAFITHQLNIKTGMGLWVDKLIRWANQFFISKFDECWIPDAAGSINLAGELSHGDIPENAVYIGPLSRFSKGNDSIPGLLLVILSGPEPQRSILEKILEKQLSAYPGKVCIVRGIPGEKIKPEDSANVQWYNHLPAKDLQELMSAAELVICRSGYTTVMDLVKMQKKAILVPTPGQTEQEYLAVYLMQQQLFLSEQQDEIDIQRTLQKAATFMFRIPLLSFDLYQEVISRFLMETGSAKKQLT